MDDGLQDVELENGRLAMVENLKPHTSQANENLRKGVQLVPDYIIFAKDKPFVQTVKITTDKASSLKLYEAEVTAFLEV